MSDIVQNYEQAIAFLFDRINFERTPADSKQDFKLDRMRRLLEHLGNPQSRLPCIHIAGTKGKGSTAVMLSEMLTSAGYRVGLYTSPHVEAFEERMQVAGSRPNAAQLVELVRQIAPAVRQCESDVTPFSPTFFEVTTALAWLFFIQEQCDIVVLEVGLGGRLDSTNVCSSIVCVLTTISRDHTQLLGSALSQIAREKAGIVKHQIPVVSGVVGDDATSVIGEVCHERQSELWQLERDFSYCRHADENTVDVQTPRNFWERMPLMLVGEHQAHNAAVALATIDRLNQSGWKISEAAAREGLLRVRWPMRIEVVSREPTVIIDAAHNWESMTALGRTLDESFPRDSTKSSANRRVLIFASSKDKDVAGLLRQLLPRFDSIILTRYVNNPRAVSPDQLLQTVRAIGTCPCHVADTPTDAWMLAQRITTPNDLICVTGSFFIAAEIRDQVLE